MSADRAARYTEMVTPLVEAVDRSLPHPERDPDLGIGDAIRAQAESVKDSPEVMAILLRRFRTTGPHMDGGTIERRVVRRLMEYILSNRGAAERALAEVETTTDDLYRDMLLARLEYVLRDTLRDTPGGRAVRSGFERLARAAHAGVRVMQLWNGLRRDPAGLDSVIDLLPPLLLDPDAAVRAGARREAADETLWRDLSPAGQDWFRTALESALVLPPTGDAPGFPVDYDADEPDHLVLSLLHAGPMYHSPVFVERALAVAHDVWEHWPDMVRYLPAAQVPTVLDWAERRDRRGLGAVLDALATRDDVPLSAEQLLRWATSGDARVRLAVQSLAGRVAQRGGRTR